ncbi:hypothetical protein niasHS_005153 [Heterodera schachtii]|uniref:Nuclear receptor domain-containing protein n=1 Tax=Heterodera schachtii TaxID=97005 RepID=A0ABD2JRN5_HETSC
MPKAELIPKNEPKKCLICGGLSSFKYYSIPSCEACKQFFRRTVTLQIQYVCKKRGNCEMSTPHNKRKCGGCRLNKCLIMGMEPQMVNARNEFIAKQFLDNLNKRKMDLLSKQKTTPIKSLAKDDSIDQKNQLSANQMPSPMDEVAMASPKNGHKICDKNGTTDQSQSEPAEEPAKDKVNDYPANDYPANDYPANDYPANDYPANDKAKDYPAKDKANDKANNYAAKDKANDYPAKEEANDSPLKVFPNSVIGIDGAISAKTAETLDTINQLSCVQFRVVQFFAMDRKLRPEMINKYTSFRELLESPISILNDMDKLTVQIEHQWERNWDHFKCLHLFSLLDLFRSIPAFCTVDLDDQVRLANYVGSAVYLMSTNFHSNIVNFDTEKEFKLSTFMISANLCLEEFLLLRAIVICHSSIN